MTLPEIRELIQKGELIQAEKLCRDLIAKFPDDADANIVFGKILANQGKYEEAISFFEEISNRFPRNFDIYFFLGRLYEHANEDFENALRNYQLARSVDFRSSAVNFRIGEILNNYQHKERDEDEAKRYYQYAVNGDVPIEDAYCNLAFLEKSKRSLVILRHGLTYFPQSIKLYELLARRNL